MLSHRIALKLYADPTTVPAGAKVLEAWHGWIKRSALPELLVDVVDYGHVHRGPSVLLVGHESDYALDLGEGRPGLLYVRKRAPDPAPVSALDDSLTRLFRAAAMLEGEPTCAGLRFLTGELSLRVLDRLRAPNVPATWAADRAEVLETLGRRLGAGCEASYDQTDPGAPFSVRAACASPRPLADLARA